MLQQRDYLGAFDAGKTFQEIINRIAGFQMIEETLDGDTRPDEHRHSTEDVRVRMIDVILLHAANLLPGWMPFKRSYNPRLSPRFGLLSASTMISWTVLPAGIIGSTCSV